MYTYDALVNMTIDIYYPTVAPQSNWLFCGFCFRTFLVQTLSLYVHKYSLTHHYVYILIYTHYFGTSASRYRQIQCSGDLSLTLVWSIWSKGSVAQSHHNHKHITYIFRHIHNMWMLWLCIFWLKSKTYLFLSSDCWPCYVDAYFYVFWCIFLI